MPPFIASYLRRLTMMATTGGEKYRRPIGFNWVGVAFTFLKPPRLPRDQLWIRHWSVNSCFGLPFLLITGTSITIINVGDLFSCTAVDTSAFVVPLILSFLVLPNSDPRHPSQHPHFRHVQLLRLRFHIGVNRPAFGETVPHFHQMSRVPRNETDVQHFFFKW